jgi:mannose-6-phosphate isomerase-like protein (cupin superfamily)
MTVLPAGAGRRFLGGAGVVKVESGAADFSAFEQSVPAGFPPVPLHIHDRYDEAFFIIEGEMHFVIGDATSVATTGSFVFVPRGSPHRFWNESTAPARMLAIGSSGVQSLVEELAPLVQTRPLDPAALRAAFERHHSRIVEL